MAQWWRKKTAKWKGNFCSNRLQREEWSTSKNRLFPPGNFGFILAPFTFQPFAPKISAKWKVSVSPLPPPPQPQSCSNRLRGRNAKWKGKREIERARESRGERGARRKEEGNEAFFSRSSTLPSHPLPSSILSSRPHKLKPSFVTDISNSSPFGLQQNCILHSSNFNANSKN